MLHTFLHYLYKKHNSKHNSIKKGQGPTDVLDEGLRIRGRGRRMNLKVKVSRNKCIPKVNVGVQPGLLSICPTPSPPGPYI
jgi:hypothetical protein